MFTTVFISEIIVKKKKKKQRRKDKRSGCAITAQIIKNNEFAELYPRECKGEGLF